MVPLTFSDRLSLDEKKQLTSLNIFVATALKQLAVQGDNLETLGFGVSKASDAEAFEAFVHWTVGGRFSLEAIQWGLPVCSETLLPVVVEQGGLSQNEKQKLTRMNIVFACALSELACADGDLSVLGDEEAEEPAPETFLDLVMQYANGVASRAYVEDLMEKAGEGILPMILADTEKDPIIAN